MLETAKRSLEKKTVDFGPSTTGHLRAVWEDE